MKIGVVVAFWLTLSGCANSAYHVTCSGPYNADPRAVEKRVLAAHRYLSASSVLKCISTPGSGWSDGPDQEACVVLIDVAASEKYLIAFYSSRSVTVAPAVVSELASELMPIRAVRGNSGYAASNEPLLFDTSDSRTVILYAPYERCFVVEEVI